MLPEFPVLFSIASPLVFLKDLWTSERCPRQHKCGVFTCGLSNVWNRDSALVLILQPIEKRIWDHRPLQIWAGDEGAVWRLILDLKQSRVKEGTRKDHRVPLPRATDVVSDIKDTFHKHPLGTDEQLELLVPDCVDAFWNVPLMASERTFFVGKLRFRFHISQGSSVFSERAPC